MNGKSRIIKVCNHGKPDRMPCFTANSSVTYGQMEAVGAYWPEGHKNGEVMAKLALAAHTVLGFDAVRVPFCQTFESVALGCKYKPSDPIDGIEGIPGIDEPHPYTIDDTPVLPPDFLSRGMIPDLLKAVKILKEKVNDEVAIVGGIIGPMTLASAMLGPVPLLKATFKTPDKLRSFLDVGEKAGTALALALIDAGADIICCEDMTASPELIAPHTYKDLELEFQQKQFNRIPVPKILHICGNVTPVIKWLAETGANILSLDTKTDPQVAREQCGQDIILLGGVDPANTLLMGDPDAVKKECELSISRGIQILAPGCALAPTTPTENLLAMVEVAQRH